LLLLQLNNRHIEKGSLEKGLLVVQSQIAIDVVLVVLESNHGTSRVDYSTHALYLIVFALHYERYYFHLMLELEIN
jgi:hypothetical protein